MKKNLFVIPETDVLEVRFKSNLLQGSDPQATVSANMSRGGYEYDDLDS